MHIKRSRRSRWLSMLVCMAVTAASAVLLMAGPSTGVTAAPVLRLLPSHLLGTATTKARGSTTATSSASVLGVIELVGLCGE